VTSSAVTGAVVPTPATRPPVVAIVGATASGKSAVSLAVAQLLEAWGGAEVVNADSMQFYRGMDIGTAKLTPAERQGVPHHQLDTLDVSQDASAARYQADGRADIEAIYTRGKVPVVVGGSGLYIRALLDEFEFPGTDPALRAALEARAESEGPGILHRELTARDPIAAAKVSPQNAKRIVRALEILDLHGAYASSLPVHTYAVPAVQVALRVDQDALDDRILKRVGSMWQAGLVEEVRRLVDQGIREATTARRAVGYAETLQFLDGEIDAPTAQELIARNTRRLARRQRRWFTPDPRVTWIDAPHDAADVDRAARDALEVFSRAQ
jgi:tRNA dimethylallyltransferase